MFYCGAKIRNKKETCKQKVSKKNARCRFHKKGRKAKTFENSGTLYSYGNNLSRIYSRNSKKKSILKKALNGMENSHDLIEDYSYNLEPEIIMARALIRDSFRELELLIENTKDDTRTLGKRQWLRNQILDGTKKLAEIMREHNKIKFGPNNTVTVKKIEQVFLMLNDILIRNITDANLLLKIVDDIERTIVVEPGE